MKRISVAFLLMLLSSTAHAGYSFSVGGHFIHIDASRHCRSLSCVSWSDSRPRRAHRDDDEAIAPATPRTARPGARETADALLYSVSASGSDTFICARTRARRIHTMETPTE